MTKSYEEYWSQLKSSSAYHPANRLRYHLIRKAIIGLPLGDLSRRSVIDIGCGDGSLLREVSTLAEWKSLTGLDVSKEVIARNQELMPSVQFIAQDAGHPLDLESAQYDLVLSSEVIEHVEDDRAFVENLGRLCKPGGFIVLTTQSGPRYRMDREVLGHLRHYTREELRSLFESQAMQVVSLTQAGFPWLNLQKKAVDLCFDAVKRNVLETNDLSKAKRLAMDALTGLYRLSIPNWGPQLIAVLKPSA